VARLLALRAPRAGVGGAWVGVVAAGDWLCDWSWGAIYMDGGIMFIKKVNHASPCEGHEDIIWGKGKLPRVPDDIEDAMSDGSGNDEGQAEGGLSIPQVFGEVLLIGDGFGNEDEGEGEGLVWVAGVNEFRDILVAHKEPPDIVDGSGEGVGLEVGGRHGERGVWVVESWLASCKC